jgi:hypothetical protein
MDATASRPPDQSYSKLHFIPEFAKNYKVAFTAYLKGTMTHGGDLIELSSAPAHAAIYFSTFRNTA